MEASFRKAGNERYVGQFAGQVGNVIGKGTNELMIPNYKNVWADIRRIGRTPGAEHISFKPIEYPADL